MKYGIIIFLLLILIMSIVSAYENRKNKKLFWVSVLSAITILAYIGLRIIRDFN